MKLSYILICVVFSILVGNQNMIAQQSGEFNKEEFTARVKANASQKKSKFKNKNRSVAKSAGTSRLYSKEQIAARARTAQKTKSSVKSRISPEEARKQRAARIEAIKAANKRKKKPSLRRNNQ